MAIPFPRCQPPGVHWVAVCVDRVASLGIVMADMIACPSSPTQAVQPDHWPAGHQKRKFPLLSQRMVIICLLSGKVKGMNRRHTKQRRNLLWFRGYVSFHGCFRYEHQLKSKLPIKAVNCKVDSGFNSILLEASSSFCINNLVWSCVIYNLRSVM